MVYWSSMKDFCKLVNDKFRCIVAVSIWPSLDTKEEMGILVCMQVTSVEFMSIRADEIHEIEQTRNCWSYLYMTMMGLKLLFPTLGPRYGH